MKKKPQVVGWREWLALPEFGMPAIKAKVDTGARTSALHAFSIERFKRERRDYVRFNVQPLQRDTALMVTVETPLVDIRRVTNSGGQFEKRYVVATRLEIGSVSKEIELTLTERHDMLFRMLIGRTALAGSMIVDSGASFVCGRLSRRMLYASLNDENES